MRYRLGLVFLGLGLMGCSGGAERQAEAFLSEYNGRYQEYARAAGEASWEANTYIVAGDTTRAAAETAAQQAFARYVGSDFVLDKARELLSKRDQLTPLQALQLEKVLYNGTPNAESISEVVAARIAQETAANQKLYGFDFQLYGRPTTPNVLDSLLIASRDAQTRAAIWNASKAVGGVLKEDLAHLRTLRNQSVRALGYADYFTYQVSDYGMTSQDMRQLCYRLVREVWPLYRELHTYARYTLAERYGEAVPEWLPAHWLPNRWGQDWSALVEVAQGNRLNEALAEKGPEWLVRQAEGFYVSLGFPPLPESFYTKSSLYELPKGTPYKKNNHASAWHVDLDTDVRSLMSVVPNERWYETTHHELGHIYYYIAYTRPEVPIVLRGGANRAFHEALGSLMGFAAMQSPFVGDIAEFAPEEAVRTDLDVLLKEALNFVVFLPWAAGAMTEFEYALYAESIPISNFNARWWSEKKRFQGIVPPTDRNEDYCDAATKTHIINDAAQYYDYALSFVLLFQIHQHIAVQLLDEDPRRTHYHGRTEVGNFLKPLLAAGATRDWRVLLQETIGEDIQARALLAYFEPLMAYLQEQNADRVHTLPNESPSI